MKTLMKIGFIVEVISIIGMTILFLIVGTEWIRIETIFQKVVVTILSITMAGVVAYYWWRHRNKEFKKTGDK